MRLPRDDMRAWRVEVVGPGKRWGRYTGLLSSFTLRLSHDLMIGFGRRWYAVITNDQDPSRKYTALGKNQHEAFAKALARLEQEEQR